MFSEAKLQRSAECFWSEATLSISDFINRFEQQTCLKAWPRASDFVAPLNMTTS
jgi:hypothetical protein